MTNPRINVSHPKPKGWKKKQRRADDTSKQKIAFCQKLNDLGFVSYSEYLKSHHWKSFKGKVRKSTKRKACAICKTSGGLQLHHVNYDNLGREKIEDVIYLCREHHILTHEEAKKNKYGLGESIKRVRAKFLKSNNDACRVRISIPSPEEVLSLRTANGAWTRKSLWQLGVPYPPEKGWRKKLEDEWKRQGGRAEPYLGLTP
jgi:hypothetical protein